MRNYIFYLTLSLFGPLLLTAFILADDATGNQLLPSNRKFISITWNSVLLIPHDLALVAGSKMTLVR